MIRPFGKSLQGPFILTICICVIYQCHGLVACFMLYIGQKGDTVHSMLSRHSYTAGEIAELEEERVERTDTAIAGFSTRPEDRR